MICARHQQLPILVGTSLFLLCAIALPPPAHAQHPYFPLKAGARWTYSYPGVNDPSHSSSNVRRVVDVNEADAIYRVQEDSRIGTLPLSRNVHTYEVRNGNVLHMSDEVSGEYAAALGTQGLHLKIPALIVLRANLQKGMHWKDGPKKGMRECTVLDFVDLRVSAGDFKNVAKLLVKIPYIHSETNREEFGPTTHEYYAPDVGLLKVEVLQKDGAVATYLELTEYVAPADVR